MRVIEATNNYTRPLHIQSTAQRMSANSHAPTPPPPRPPGQELPSISNPPPTPPTHGLYIQQFFSRNEESLEALQHPQLDFQINGLVTSLILRPQELQVLSQITIDSYLFIHLQNPVIDDTESTNEAITRLQKELNLTNHEIGTQNRTLDSLSTKADKLNKCSKTPMHTEITILDKELNDLLTKLNSEKKDELFILLKEIVGLKKKKLTLLHNIIVHLKVITQPTREEIGAENEIIDLSCPITLALMVDPVTASDGHVYERQAIQVWLVDSNKSPKTGGDLPNKNLRPNFPLLKQIMEKFPYDQNHSLREENYKKQAAAIIIQNTFRKNMSKHSIVTYCDCEEEYEPSSAADDSYSDTDSFLSGAQMTSHLNNISETDRYSIGPALIQIRNLVAQIPNIYQDTGEGVGPWLSESRPPTSNQTHISAIEESIDDSISQPTILTQPTTSRSRRSFLGGSLAQVRRSLLIRLRRTRRSD